MFFLFFSYFSLLIFYTSPRQWGLRGYLLLAKVELRVHLKKSFLRNVPLIVNKLQRQKNMIRDYFKWTQLLSYLFPKKKGFTS